ncbi:hypothetical protein JHK82_030103 [Glycine max]|uniref:Uncharacterized protein n=2 Tax=Glycine subgen. Soja TaxID=1462606 RepID=K7LN41_SOYBN|nr:hypothetical protein JHK87_029990 [Glycine soja]KAG4987746.1 hypothetical protein JHK85_030729 [Glycine max]KAG4993365.1 hypothetical protein JHK86_030192 [Glycine max]KAG5123366.1 hypothetical protein JHK82_030103 [Glycine max]KAG5144786.1 hypothetical protein JHK84_030329 [Glycine max]
MVLVNCDIFNSRSFAYVSFSVCDFASCLWLFNEHNYMLNLRRGINTGTNIHVSAHHIMVSLCCPTLIISSVTGW